MADKYLQLSDIDAYRVAFHPSNYVWPIVQEWDAFARNTIGGQFVRSVDSCSANVAEGFGRYTKKDKINFYRYTFASVKEALDWNEKARARGLLAEAQYVHIYQELQKLPKLVHQLIQFTNEKLRQ